jgi:hypothetical protein
MLSMFGNHEALGHTRPRFQTGGNNHVLGIVFGRVLHTEEPSGPSVRLFSKRARERQEAYERGDYKTYVGTVYLRPEQGSGLNQQEWSFQDATPVPPPNSDPDTGYENHVLHSGDYLTIFDPNNRSHAVWEGRIALYTKGISNPQGKPWGYMHQKGVDEGDFFRWFNERYPAELRTPIKPGRFATVGQTSELNNRPQALAGAA